MGKRYMKILLTGAFGNIGESTLLALIKKEYDILCLDLDTDRNRNKESSLREKGPFRTVWGSITDLELVKSAVVGKDAVIHLAAIIPPLSEKKPELAREVNVQGTANVVQAIEEMETKPKLIFASSVSTFGPRSPDMPPVDASTPVNPTDNYTHHKVECERIIKESGIPWTILKLTAVPTLELNMEMDPMVFEMPLEQKIEFAHTRDVGVAFANAIEAETIGKTLLIGGGPNCQLYCSEFTGRLMKAMGIGTLPDDAFKKPENPDEWYYTSWMDTQESQALLQFQQRTLDDYINEMKQIMGAKRYITKILSPLLRRMIAKKSPYYHA
ncbi:MAG: NAD(P)-dependent oxidoreductase [Candidatus Thorarchaeota archaeon]|nr:NAD(P)-dependent oxidoreductase [Candidatus Thorarchaeota archaeon]